MSRFTEFQRTPVQNRPVLWILVVLSLHLLVPALRAQQTGAESGMRLSSANQVNIEILHDRNVIPAGTSARVAVLLNLEEGWHVNSDRPSLDFLIGTRLDVEALEGLRPVSVHYPASTSYKFDFADQPVDVFEGDAPVVVTLRTDENLAPGSYELPSSLRIQACNNEVCLAPTTVDLTIPVEVTAAGTGYQALNSDLFDNIGTTGGSISDVMSARGGQDVAALFDSMGLFWAFAGIFLIGLALNLTPCVYPMLSVTVSLFGGQGGGDRKLGHSFMMASVYVAGIVTMYSVLGVAAAWTGALFGSWLQSPWVLGGIGLLILALSLSMFGLYELQPPSSWMQSLSGAQRKAGGLFGHYFSGLVVGVFAAPCIGPPIIALLAFVGGHGDPLFGFAIFSVMALGLGFPYLILGTFSSLLSRLPQSGAWMVWVKKVFGVVLVGVALFYLSLAFFPAWSLHSIVITLLVGGIYLGFVERSGRDNRSVRRLQWITGVAAIGVSVMLFLNLQKEGIEWETWDEDEFEKALAEGKPVMMDFYADWCIPCLELQRATFTDGQVIESTQPFRRFKVDLTHYDSEQSEALRQQFGIAGVPTILFINMDGKEVEEARVVGFLNPERFLERVALVFDDSRGIETVGEETVQQGLPVSGSR